MAVDCSIYCFHCNHNTRCLPPKFCITIFSNFSWVLQSSQEKPKTMVCKIWGCKQGQGAKKIIFTACHSGKLKLAFTSPDVISTSPKSFLTSRIDFTVLLLFEFLKKHHLPVGRVKNRIHQPDSKIQQPQAIRLYFLCTLKVHYGLGENGQQNIFAYYQH